MKLKVGKYRTEAGSTMIISGKYAGISTVEFDWLEEDACCECVPEPYEVDGDLVWHCDYCVGGRAELFPTDTPPDKSQDGTPSSQNGSVTYR